MRKKPDGYGDRRGGFDRPVLTVIFRPARASPAVLTRSPGTLVSRLARASLPGFGAAPVPIAAAVGPPGAPLEGPRILAFKVGVMIRARRFVYPRRQQFEVE
ncbi:MAG TPA: hypothetical protein VJU77_18445 [Chthoniobacterales bacterium]|nr:hypothetical protein [Chthoniobacterales bacterium]